VSTSEAQTEQLQSKDRTAIVFEKAGAGPPVVLVDGAFGSRASGPNGPTGLLLEPHFTVYRYDRRGRGESGDSPPYSPDREIEDLECVIEAAGGAASVFGTSSGGNLALRTAAAGKTIRKLALWEPNFIVNDGRPPLPADYVEHLRELVASDRSGDAIEYFMTAAVGMPPELVAAMRDMPI
jgi:pimeloyl-ACP methyl ester carboxylesterase